MVFDLDGTLVDTIDLIVASYQHAFGHVLGEEQDEAVIRTWIGQPLIRAFRAGWPEQADELFATYLAWNHANTERLIRTYAGVAGMLSALRSAGVQVAAATSKLREPAQLALQVTGLADHVGVLVTSRTRPSTSPPRRHCSSRSSASAPTRRTRHTSGTRSSTCRPPGLRGWPRWP